MVKTVVLVPYMVKSGALHTAKLSPKKSKNMTFTILNHDFTDQLFGPCVSFQVLLSTKSYEINISLSINNKLVLRFALF